MVSWEGRAYDLGVAIGHKPFIGDSVIDTLHKIIYEPAPAITYINPSASPELQRVIRKCLAKGPEKRYQTIRDTNNDLEKLLEGVCQRQGLP